MDGPRGYYVKGNKSNREIKTPYDFTYMLNLKISKQNKNSFISTENKQVPQGKEEGDG